MKEGNIGTDNDVFSFIVNFCHECFNFFVTGLKYKIKIHMSCQCLSNTNAKLITFHGLQTIHTVFLLPLIRLSLLFLQ